MNLSAVEEQQINEAVIYIKTHRDELVQKFADPALYLPDEHPVSLFMAGSPGAGKTETSKRLIETFSSKPVRIDADEIREFCPGYSGTNSYIFQRAASKGVNILYDFVLDKRFNTILDGTFAYGGVGETIERTLHHNRKPILYYIWQEPSQAWELVLAREALEHRRVSVDVFVHALVAARQNVDNIKKQFREKIELNLIVKDFHANTEQVELDIDTLDRYLPKRYTEEEILIMIKK